ncbi:hypothetical protein COO60DRAFT_1643793 [Scenedesmus sp. NREL 46B-D3]|nr:hypothetical protein COO60DRAFT_1643793 [Scenedesmus sp. NREL 46B-D3]
MCSDDGACDPLIVARTGELVCQLCGLVLSIGDMADTEPLQYTSEGKDDSRVGMPIDMLLPNLSMGTSIGGRGKQASRQRMLNAHFNMPYRERALLKAFRIIAAASSALGLQEAVVAAAKQTFARLREASGTRRGAIYKAMPAVSTYFAAKLARSSYRPREMVCDAFGVDAAEFSKCYKHALDFSRSSPYYAGMIAAVDATSLTMLMLNTMPDIVPRQRQAEVRRTIYKLHDLVVAKSPEIACQSDLTLIAAEVLVACELLGLSCPRADAAECAGVSHATLARYVKRVHQSLPPLD